MIKKHIKVYSCIFCQFEFTNVDAIKVCSNCFACTGCEIFTCPNCGYENIFKEMKKPDWDK